ncbi:hypothetical protein GCM10020295_07840 [Streptomyces cinereospinus]
MRFSSRGGSHEIRPDLPSPAAAPWAEDSEERLFNEALEQIELADRLGLDYAWATEHHFFEEYSHSSAPEVFLAAAAPAPAGSGSRTASCTCRPRSTTRRASPSGSACST